MDRARKTSALLISLSGFFMAEAGEGTSAPAAISGTDDLDSGDVPSI